MNPYLVRAYIGIGSNLNNPVAQVRSALTALDAIPGTCCIAHSSLYQSEPMGPPDQPKYINAVAAVDTRLKPMTLFKELQSVEQQHGRRRGLQRWGARTLDLDLLLYGDNRMDDDVLTVPHPGLPLRNFVLYPLHEIAPGLHIPGVGSLRCLLEACSPIGLQAMPAAV